MSTDDEIILSCASRYALGRQTYVVGVVAKKLIDSYSELPASTRQRIAREIQEYQDEHGKAGSDFDDKEWNKVKWLFRGSPVTIRAQNADTKEWGDHSAIFGDDGRYYTMDMGATYHTVKP